MQHSHPRSQPRPRPTAASTASPTKAVSCSKPAKIAGEPIDEAARPVQGRRKTASATAPASNWAAGRPTKVIAAAKKWIAGLDKKDPDYEHHMLEALWLHQYHNVVNVDLLKQRC